MCSLQTHTGDYGCPTAAILWLPWDARSRPYVFILSGKKYIKFNYKKVLEQERKTFLKRTKSRDSAAKKNRYKRSRDK